jgi:hypothetical protein
MEQRKALPLLAALLLAVIFMAACGQSTPATPAAAALALSPSPTTIPPTGTPTAVPATETAVAPSATAVPPTSTPEPTDTATAVPPTSTPTAEPPTATPVPPTATSVPPTAVPRPTLAPTPAALLKVDWKTGIEYIPRNGTSNWCQMHNQYHNNSGADVSFQATPYSSVGSTPNAKYSGYDPIFGIANPDGFINAWRVGGWYSKMLGWPNGIPGLPPDIKAGTVSDDWTWYSVAATNGEYCRFVYVKFKGQISAAEYSAKGDLVNPNATLPAGAP